MANRVGKSLAAAVITRLVEEVENPSRQKDKAAWKKFLETARTVARALHKDADDEVKEMEEDRDDIPVEDIH